MNGVVVVTGAASGIGLACAEALAPRRGLLLVDVRAEPLALAEQKLQSGAACASIAGDLCDGATLRAIADRTEALGGVADWCTAPASRPRWPTPGASSR